VTWRIVDSNPAIQSYPFCLANNSNIFGANLAWGRNNTLYLATQAWDTAERNKTSIMLAKSTNLGDSWTSVLVADARPIPDGDEKAVNNRPVTGIVVDSESGSQDTVYVLFRQAYTGFTAPNARPQQPMVGISRDAGKTFELVSALGNPFGTDQIRESGLSVRTTVAGATTTTAVPGSLAATPNNATNFGANSNGEGIVMDDDGNIYVAYTSATANITPSVPSAVVVSKSTDKGKTWTGVIARPFSYENAQNPKIAWSPGGGSQGTLHVVWEWRHPATLNTYADVGYIRSTDGGKTWSEAKRIADDDYNALYAKYLPEIKVAPNGSVDAVWWDLRHDVGIRGMDVYYAYSEDDGQTWSKNIRMTDQTIDRRFGVWGNNFDQNSQPGLLSLNEYAMVGWDDTRLSRGEEGTVVGDNPVLPAGEGGLVDVGSGVQDMFVASVQFEPLGGGSSKAAKIVLAGVLGLLAVGLVLTLMTLSSRRKAGPATASKATKKSPASVK
jgi:hypothetical protein